jgi:hypothetical protein
MTEIPEDVRFALTIASAMAADTASTTNSLMRMMRISDREKEAVIALIRREVSNLANSPVLVNPDRYASALFPYGAEIEEYLEEKYGPDWRDQ